MKFVSLEVSLNFIVSKYKKHIDSILSSDISSEEQSNYIRLYPEFDTVEKRLLNKPS